MKERIKEKKYQISNSTDAPTCAPQQPRVYGVAKHENAQIKCVVDANPPEVGKLKSLKFNLMHINLSRHCQGMENVAKKLFKNPIFSLLDSKFS